MLTQSCLLLYTFCANLLRSFMWLMVSSLSPHIIIIFIIIIFIILLIFSPSTLADGIPLKTEWHQVSWSFQDSSRYSGRSQQYCYLEGLHCSTYIQVLPSLNQSFNDCTHIKTGITITFMFHRFYVLQQGLYAYFFFSISFSFTKWSVSLFFYWLSLCLLVRLR